MVPSTCLPQVIGDQNLMGLCITGDCKANTGTAKQEQLVKSVLERLQGKRCDIY